MDRYAVVIVSKHIGFSHTWQEIFVGEEGAEQAHALAEAWNAKHPWAAFVVGLHPETVPA
ncbi:hypothetical protein SEA_KALNOKY_81 [Mycobacterium phage Kalnoky]|uniref:Uncharacterized protein n=1 Tax=Mycobacterium phage PurpleHaze TaxID=1983577 RepID=A0A220NS02_9CAUD|nr:hypothetical protein KIJ57_gp13 [Mycobacterium phage Purple Haze]AVJ50822.1 hypothetical protein SEA_OLANP_79 [Mycobacterium phage OlanP]AXH44127.1 hypothetical protein SEA_KALNOKY_81 [Mycobacterium phage Kalnoky]AXH44535.1 hypothetical protein SEA_MARIUS_81 [Mycobacterium phage Marius]AXH44705.1 hypothetical protein SEA_PHISHRPHRIENDS_77 [Mycobacterium phage PhishRPhriends]AXH44852.1 hypothetical protein SEA_REBA_76 [Mycobacterium phage Reba]QAY03004.1 hypothetical protein SEA_GEMMA_78 [M